MNNSLTKSILLEQLSFPAKKAVLGQLAFIVIAVLLPTLTHFFGPGYRLTQPMHWMMFFAGLVYGPLSGAIMGISVPLLSFVFSGMPLPPMLPLMIPELMAYGIIAGLLKKHITSFGAITAASIAGKLVYIALAYILGRSSGNPFVYATQTWSSSILSILLMIPIIPLLSGIYVNAFSGNRPKSE